MAISNEEINQFLATPQGEPQGLPGMPDVDSFLREEALKEQYGTGVLNEAQAFVEGGLRGLSFGLSDVALQGLPGETFSKEAIRARKEYNPTAAVGGEVIGVAGPLVASGGTSLLAKGAQTLGKGVLGVDKLGRLTTKAIQNQFSSEATKGLAKQIISKAAPRALGSAVEGGLYSSGQYLSEYALGDKEFNAEALLSTVGLGALLGGGIGGAFGTIEAVGPTFIQQTKNLAAKIGDYANIDPEAGPLFTLGKRGREARAMATPTRQEAEERIRSATEAMAEHYKRMDDVSSLLTQVRNTQVEGFLNTLDPISIKSAQKEGGALLKTLKKSMNEMLDEPDVYSKGTVKKLGPIIDSLETKIYAADNPAEVFRALDDAKILMAPMAKFGKIASDVEKETANRIGKLYGQFAKHLEDESIYGMAGMAQREANEAFTNFLAQKKRLNETVMQKVTNKKGERVYEFSPTKIDTYFRNVDTVRNDLKDAALFDYLKASDELLERAKSGLEPIENLGVANAALKLNHIRGRVDKALNDLSKRAAWVPIPDATPVLGKVNEVLGELAVSPKGAKFRPAMDKIYKTINVARTDRTVENVRRAISEVDNFRNRLLKDSSIMAEDKSFDAFISALRDPDSLEKFKAAYPDAFKRVDEFINKIDSNIDEMLAGKQYQSFKESFREIETALEHKGGFNAKDLAKMKKPDLAKATGDELVDYMMAKSYREKALSPFEVLYGLDQLEKRLAAKFNLDDFVDKNPISKLFEHRYGANKEHSAVQVFSSLSRDVDQFNKEIIKAMSNRAQSVGTEELIGVYKALDEIKRLSPEQRAKIEPLKLALLEKIESKNPGMIMPASMNVKRFLRDQKVKAKDIPGLIKRLEQEGGLDEINATIGDDLRSLAEPHPLFASGPSQIDTYEKVLAGTKTEIQDQIKRAQFRSALQNLKRDNTDSIVTPLDLAGGSIAYAIGGPIGLGAASILKMINNPYQIVQAMAAIERVAMRVGNRIDRNVGAFINAAKNLPDVPDLRPAVTPVAVVLANQEGELSDDVDSQKEKAYNKVFKDLSFFMADPNKWVEKLSERTNNLKSVLPETGAVFEDRSNRALQYLFEKAPKNPYVNDLFKDSKWRPSDFELAAWQRRVRAIEDPLIVLKELKNGVLSSETIETIEAVYPKLFQKIQMVMVEKLTNRKLELPYAVRLQIEKLLKIKTTTEAPIQMLQMNFQSDMTQPDQNNVSPSRADKLKFSESRQTSTDRITAR